MNTSHAHMGHARANSVSGLTELAVLRCLSEREMYGYELAQAIRGLTGGELEVREGLLYPLLHTLSAGGLVTRRRQVVEGRARFYYEATAKGRRRLGALREDWGRIVAAVNRVLA